MNSVRSCVKGTVGIISVDPFHLWITCSIYNEGTLNNFYDQK